MTTPQTTHFKIASALLLLAVGVMIIGQPSQPSYDQVTGQVASSSAGEIECSCYVPNGWQYRDGNCNGKGSQGACDAGTCKISQQREEEGRKYTAFIDSRCVWGKEEEKKEKEVCGRCEKPRTGETLLSECPTHPDEGMTCGTYKCAYQKRGELGEIRYADCKVVAAGAS